MSTNRNVVNLSIAIVKTLVKMAGFGCVADMIEGSQECLNLLADIKNDALGNPNAEMIRALNGAIKSELHTIQDALQRAGLSRKQIKDAVAQLSDAACQTIKELAEDDNALIRAIQQPEHFIEDLKSHAAPLPDDLSTDIQDHYETLLDQIAEKFLTLAPWSPSFDRVALTSLLRCFPALSERIDRLEQHMDRRFDHIELGMREDRDIHIENNQLLKGLSRQNASPIFDHVVFGSRPDVVAGDSFVPRGEQEQLNALIADPRRRRTVLVGMRGCGKTQLAAALAEKCEDKNWSLVAWLNAGPLESITSDLVELAKRLKIDTSDQPTPETIIRRCFDQLKSEDPSDRLIVFDNVEDINDLRGLVPTGDGLRVVVTTTNDKGWNYHGWDAIRIGVFDREKSIDYLLTVAESADRAAADTLADRLGDLPLALAQAAVTARNKDLSLTRYLDRLDSYRSERVIRPIPGDYYAVDVATALCMAIEDALENLEDGTKQAARYILGALALLAEFGVPTRWLDPMSEEHDEQELQDHDRAEDEDAHDALTELIHRSIVQQSSDKATTVLHRLQAQVLRESWSQDDQAEALEATADLLGSVRIDSLRRSDAYLRQYETRNLIRHLRHIGTGSNALALLSDQRILASINHAFNHAEDLWLADEAISLQDIFIVLALILHRYDLTMLILRAQIANAYKQAGRANEIVPAVEELQNDCIETLGHTAQITLAVKNLLAGIYRDTDRFEEAVDVYKQLLSDATDTLGPDNLNTLTIKNNLAVAYEDSGDTSKAIDLHTQSVANCAQIFGPMHPATLSARNNLAGAILKAGMVNKAIYLYSELADDSITILGISDLKTIDTRNNLAHCYMLSQQFTKAATIYEDNLTILTQIYGKEDRRTQEAEIRLRKCCLMQNDK